MARDNLMKSVLKDISLKILPLRKYSLHSGKDLALVQIFRHVRGQPKMH